MNNPSLVPDELEWLDTIATEIGAHHERFEITDLGSADWAARRKAAALAHMAETDREYKQLIAAATARYTRWRDQRDKEDQATILRMELLLRPWFEAQKAAGKLAHKKKSLTLPSGAVVGEQWHPVQFEPNESELFPWAKAHDLIRTKEESRWTDIKKQLRLSVDGLRVVIVHEVTHDATGEITLSEEVVPGVRVKSMPANVFYVECPKEELPDALHG